MMEGIDERVLAGLYTHAPRLLEFSKPWFYCNKGAYLVGRLVSDRGLGAIVFALTHRKDTGVGWMQ